MNWRILNIHLIGRKAIPILGWQIIGAIACQVIAAGNIRAEYVLRPVVLTGQRLPGMASHEATGAAGGTFYRSLPATFAPNGDVVSPIPIVDVADPYSHLGYAVWRFPQHGNPVQLSAPAIDWGVAARSVSDDTSFYQTEYPIGSLKRERLFVVQNDSATELANNVDAAPGESIAIDYFSDIRVNDQILAFGGGLAATNPRRLGVWAWRNGEVSTVAITGQAAIGFPTGVRLDEVILRGVSNSGQILLQTEVPHTGSINRDWAFYRNDGLTSVLLLRGGQDSPIANHTFGASSIVAANAEGDYVFESRLVGPGTGASNDEAIWFYGASTPRLIARESFPVAGTDVGAQFRDFYEVSLNDKNLIALRADTYHPSRGVRNSILIDEGLGSPYVVLEVGDFVEGNRITRLSEPRLAVNGDFATEVQVVAGGSQVQGIVFYSHATQAVELIRVGDVLTIAPGDQRTIADVRLPAFDVMGQRNPGTRGEMLFYAEFTNESGGLFLATPSFLPGDFNFDGAVNTADVAAFALRFGQSVGDVSSVDLNADGRIDLGDLSMLQGYLTMSHGTAATSIPEPSPVILMIVAIAMMCFPRIVRRKLAKWSVQIK